MDTDANKRCFFTGHRIMSRYEYKRTLILTAQMCERLFLTRGVEEFISGGAVGYDYAAALAVLRLKKKYPVRLVLYLPCRDRDTRWSSAYRDRWRAVEDAADECIYITEGGYVNGCMQKRNRAMVDASRYGIAFWRGANRGGTYSTMCYARERMCELTVITVPGTKLPFGMYDKKYV